LGDSIALQPLQVWIDPRIEDLPNAQSPLRLAGSTEQNTVSRYQLRSPAELIRTPNAGPELLLEADARYERTLEAASSRPLLCG
jgi:hypothetical protein